jgi:thiamine transporter
MGSWGHLAERMVRGHRPSKPDPDNAGEGNEELSAESSLSQEERMKPTTKILAEVAVSVALAGALNLIKIYTLPQGGSITAGAMIPILWLALRRGPRWGIFAGVVFGLVVMLNPVDFYVVHPAQFLLDYPIAFGALGLAGIARKHPLVGVGIGILGRFAAHYFSGVIFFGMFAPKGMSPFLYSAIYNGSYLIGEFLVSAVIMLLLVKRKALELYL